MRNRELNNPEVPRLLRTLFADLYPVRKLLLDHHELLKPNDPNFYIMELEHGWYIDARDKGNLSRFIAGLKKANITLDRKALAEIAVNDTEAFAKLLEMAKA